jgi:hypothetical protein
MNVIPEKTPVGTADWLGIEDAARLLNFRVGAWNDLGYPEPLPFEGAHPIPPLGQRSADNIKAGHGAIEVIDEIVRELHSLRGRLIIELRTDGDIRAVRVDAMLAEARALRCGSPATCGEFGHEHPHIDDAVSTPLDIVTGDDE